MKQLFNSAISFVLVLVMLLGLVPVEPAEAAVSAVTSYDGVRARVQQYCNANGIPMDGGNSKKFWNGNKSSDAMKNAADAGNYTFGVTGNSCPAPKKTEHDVHRKDPKTGKSKRYKIKIGGNEVYACTSNGIKDCVDFTSSKTVSDYQCYGFACYMCYVVFGKNATNMDRISQTNAYSRRSKITNIYEISPGDYVRQGSHSYFVYDIVYDLKEPLKSYAYTIECNHSSAGGMCQLYTGKHSLGSILNSATYVCHSPLDTVTFAFDGSKDTAQVAFNTSAERVTTESGTQKFGIKAHYIVPECTVEKKGAEFKGYYYVQREADKKWKTNKGWKTEDEIKKDSSIEKEKIEVGSEQAINGNWVMNFTSSAASKHVLSPAVDFTFYPQWEKKSMPTYVTVSMKRGATMSKAPYDADKYDTLSWNKNLTATEIVENEYKNYWYKIQEGNKNYYVWAGGDKYDVNATKNNPLPDGAYTLSGYSETKSAKEGENKGILSGTLTAKDGVRISKIQAVVTDKSGKKVLDKPVDSPASPFKFSSLAESVNVNKLQPGTYKVTVTATLEADYVAANKKIERITKSFTLSSGTKLTISEDATKSYLDRCTSYTCYLRLKSLGNGGSDKYNIKSLPCSAATDKLSKTVRGMANGETLVATAILKNTQGNYWYKVKADNGGTEGYVYAGEVVFHSFPADSVKFSVALGYSGDVPYGKGCDITGYVLNGKLPVRKVIGKLLGSNNTSSGPRTVNGQITSLKSTDIHKKLAFGSLDYGPGWLELAAEVASNYVENGNLVTKTDYVRHGVDFHIGQRYWVSYDSNGGKGTMATSTFYSGKAANLAENGFTRTGYKFNGWNTKKDGSGTAYGNKASVKNLVATGKTLTLYAQWQASSEQKSPTYITVSMKNGAIMSTAPYDANKYDTLSGDRNLTATEIVRNIYGNYWYKIQEGNKNYYVWAGGDKYDVNATLSNPLPGGAYTLGGYSVLTAAEEGENKAISSGTLTTKAGVRISKIQAVVTDKSGNTVLDKSVSSPASPFKFSSLAESVNVNKLQPGTYKVTVMATLEADYVAADKTIKPLTKQVYLTNGSDLAVNRQAFGVTFNANGGACSESSRIVSKGAAIGELPEATREGYRFDGWYTAATGGNEMTETTAVTGDITVHAHWVQQALIEFDLNGGEGSVPEVSAMTIDCGTKPPALPVLSRNGYEFVGWFTGPEGGTQVTTDTVINQSSLRLYAVWRVVSANLGLAINEINFPSAVFRSYVSAMFDADANGYLNPSEIAAIRSVDIPDSGVQDLKGLEHFTALEYLNCSYNSLSVLDVSANTALKQLYCSNNLLTALDVSRNYALTELSCGDNALSALYVNSCSALTMLLCANNGNLGTLDLSGCAALSFLDCSNNRINRLNLSGNPELQTLYCTGNALSALDVSDHKALTALDCSGNANLSALDVSDCTSLEELILNTGYSLSSVDASGCTSLRTLNCSINSLSSLSVSGCTALVFLECFETSLTALDVSGCSSLTALNCASSPVSALNVSGCTALTYLVCNDTALTALDVSGNSKLLDLTCNNSFLTALNVSGCTTLGYLNCSNNNLSSLDVSGCVSLETLMCENNSLTALDVSHNTVLKALLCGNNLLTALDVSANRQLQLIGCDANRLATIDLSNNTALTGPALGTQRLTGVLTITNGAADMADVVGSTNIGRIISVSGAVYDKETGIASFEVDPTSITSVQYQYDSGCAAGQLTAEIAVQAVFVETLLKAPSPSPTPEVTPTPAPEVTPTPTPEVTPTPAPEVTPTPTPEVTPTPTPEVTPTPAPEVTPTPTPEVTPPPTPEVTPTPTPEVTPTPTPEVTPTPTPEVTPTPAPEVTPTPAPEVMPTPAPEVTPTPAPEVTPTPAPEATQAPEPEVPPVPAAEEIPVPEPEETPEG